MPSLIDADLFVAEINERITNAIQWGKNATEEEIKIRAEQAIATFCEALLTAKKMPTVDAEPVRHGHWMHGDEVVKLDEFGDPEVSCWCSECGDWLTGSDEYPVRGKFCPNCGAKMDEVEDDT